MSVKTLKCSAFLLAAVALAFTTLVGQAADAGLFQHLDASVANSVIDNVGTFTWLDQSGNGRDATDDFLGGTISLSTDTSVFPSELNSIDVDTLDSRARMQLLDADDAATLLDQSQVDAQGFSVFVAVRGEGGGTTWNDLIGTSSIVNDGFLMRWNNGNGRFQASVDADGHGNGTAQNNMAQIPYHVGDPMVLGVNYDPELSEITLASTHNSYSQTWAGQEPEDFTRGNPLWLGTTHNGNRFFDGQVGEVKIYDAALTPDEFADELAAIGEKWLGDPPVGGGDGLQAGDADQDLDFDQLDLVRVQIAAKYLTGQPATWGDGDWNGAPGGEPGNPPDGNGMFDQIDIIAALANGLYLTGPYAAITRDGVRDDGQTSIIYDTRTGELAVDAPNGVSLTSINIDSAAAVFTGDPAQNLGGSFDNDSDNNIFKATFGSSFSSLSFGLVAQSGLSEDFVSNDLTVVGSLAGGGDLGTVDLIYVPEPSTLAMLVFGMLLGLRCFRRGIAGG